jgi:pyruvate dehydrogenase E2 component (dihydrolipoamide acetyltransferase)
MATAVIMPKLEISQESATIVDWLKQEGDPVEKGEPLLVIETDKATLETEAPATGILADIRFVAGDRVPVTEVVAYILEPGEEPPQEDKDVAVSKSEPPGPPAGDRAATPMAQRLAKAYGVDLREVSGTGSKGLITKSDIEDVLERTVIESRTSLGKARATPAARRLAREHNQELDSVRGSGPRGRIQAADVRALAAEAPSQLAAEVIPLSQMRHTVAKRMTWSYQTTPHITLALQVDMKAFDETRSHLNAKAEPVGRAHVSTTALLVKAVASCLSRHPWINSSFRDDEIHLLSEINIGVAVALRDGLIVPVIHNADEKTVGVIAAEVSDLAQRARERRLTSSDVAGGTFTISNLGPLGVDEFTAIINPPEAAILAVGTTRREVVVEEEDRIAIRPVMRITLSADHRVIDGATAARFLADVREVLEAPELMLL